MSGMNRNSMPISEASICQGTMLAWCSMWESTTASPGQRFALPQDCATMLRASVALRVNTTSSGRAALMKRATLARAPS